MFTDSRGLTALIYGAVIGWVACRAWSDERSLIVLEARGAGIDAARDELRFRQEFDAARDEAGDRGEA